MLISVLMPGIVVRRVSLVNKLAVRMSCSTKFSYEEAIHKLNLLQSNKSTIEQIRKDIKTGLPCTTIEDMVKYLARTGVSMPMLDQLSVIHVAGTKGKGSTSAMCESILRAYGFRTGFYSSPHLVAVRERVRLAGCPISEQQFAEYFHQVYDALYYTQAYDGDMPKYFSFLTVLAFNVFLKEKVDVAIVEVGIGGTYDYTNVLRKVPVVGITALGLDHTSILGTTLPQIAAAKAGIMKPNSKAYTVQQPTEAMDVLLSVANNVKCSLNVVPEFNTYKFENGCKLPIAVEAFKTNASLAIQLAHAWMRVANKNIQNIVQKQVSSKALTNSFIEIDTVITQNEKDETILVDTLSRETVVGVQQCKWPGRYQVLKLDYATFYLDGAHTKESMEICATWFNENNRCQEKILVFSATGDRDATVLLKPLSDLGFKTVFFVIPTAYSDITKKNDNYSTMEHAELYMRCKNHANIWNELEPNSKVIALECFADALKSIKHNYPNSSVLVTGSLHLVGAALSVIDPSLNY